MKSDTTAGLLLGLGFGATTMYLLDPQRGRRRRAEVIQQLQRLGNLSEEAIVVTSRDLRNRTRGFFAEISSRFSPVPADDRILAARVRSRLGFLVDHPRSIGVVANEGRITLSGPVLVREVDRLLDDIRRVPGVKQVNNHLDIHQEPGDVSGLQGGPARRRRGEQFEFWQENWSPTARAVAGLVGTGLLLYGLRQRTLSAVLLATAGLGLLVRGVTNVDLQRLTGIDADLHAVTHDKSVDHDVMRTP